MKRLVWTPAALHDLTTIRDIIRRDKPKTALQIANKIQNKAEHLAKFPLAGRPLRLLPTVRVLRAPPYDIFYRPTPRTIQILRIYHNRQSRLVV